MRNRTCLNIHGNTKTVIDGDGRLVVMWRLDRHSETSLYEIRKYIQSPSGKIIEDDWVLESGGHVLSGLSEKQARKIFKSLGKTGFSLQPMIITGCVLVFLAISGVIYSNHEDAMSRARTMSMVMGGKGGDIMGGMSGSPAAMIPGLLPGLQAQENATASAHSETPHKHVVFRARTPISLDDGGTEQVQAHPETAPKTSSVPTPPSPSDIQDKQVSLDDLRHVEDIIPGSDFKNYEDLQKVLPDVSSKKSVLAPHP